MRKLIQNKMEKMLVVVVDGSLDLAPYWDDIKTIVENIVRMFCAGASTSSHPSDQKYGLKLVEAAKDDSPARSMENFSSVSKMDSFLYLLSSLNFNNGSRLNTTGVIEGLSKALMMFPSTHKQQQTQLLGKRHCILVTATQPYPSLKEVLIPRSQILESGEVVEVGIDNVLGNVDAIARSFVESFVSLSVICPRDMPMLRTIYDAGNQVSGLFTMGLKHPRLLLFISENFPEAREALKQFEAENYDDNDPEQDALVLLAQSFTPEEVMFLQSIVSEPQMKQHKPDYTMPIISDNELNTFVNEPIPERDVVDVFSLPKGTSFINFSSTMQQGKPGDHSHANENVTGGSLLFTPEQKEGFNALISQNIWPFEVVSLPLDKSSTNMTPNEHTTMSNLLNYRPRDPFGKLKQVHTREGTTIGSSYHPCPRTIPKPNNSFHLSTSWLEKNEKITASNSKYVSRTETQRFGSDISRGKMVVLSAKRRLASTSTWNPNHVISTNSINNSGTKDKTPIPILNTRIPKVSLSTKRPKHVMYNTIVPKGTPAKSSSHLKVPYLCKPSLSKLNGALSINAESSDQNPHRILSSEVPSGHIKAWEGSITSRGPGISVFVSKLVAYRMSTVSENIFTNWPNMMQLKHLVRLTHIRYRPIHISKEYLVFGVLDSCPTFDLMKAMNLCAHVDLPGRTLVLWISWDKTRLMGTLYEEIIPVYRDHIFKPNW